MMCCVLNRPPETNFKGCYGVLRLQSFVEDLLFLESQDQLSISVSRETG